MITAIREQRTAVYTEAKRLAQSAADAKRSFTDHEEGEWVRLNAELDAYDTRIRQLLDQEQRAKDVEDSFAKLHGQPVAGGNVAGGNVTVNPNPLSYTRQALDALQGAIDARSAGRFDARDVEQRAALATSTYGAPRVWGSNVTEGPRLLHVVAGVPQQPSDAVFAQVPNLTLPTASASVGENVTLSEYAASTAGSVTLARFGRWTDLSRESLVGADAGAIIGMHQIGCAKDLDLALITAVNTAAGTAVAFSTPVVDAIRKSQATIVDNTAAASASDLVILCHPDDVKLLESVAPIGGQTMAEGFTRFSGSIVYPSSAVPTGFMLVANLRAGARYFEAQSVMTETQVASIKLGTLTVATSVIGGYGLGLVGGATGFVQKVDVVTP
jgi:hypothetical protein